MNRHLTSYCLFVNVRSLDKSLVVCECTVTWQVPGCLWMYSHLTNPWLFVNERSLDKSLFACEWTVTWKVPVCLWMNGHLTNPCLFVNERSVDKSLIVCDWMVTWQVLGCLSCVYRQMCQVCFKYLINHSRYIFYQPSDSDIADIYRIIVDRFSIDKLKAIWPVYRDVVSALYR